MMYSIRVIHLYLSDGTSTDLSEKSKLKQRHDEYLSLYQSSNIVLLCLYYPLQFGFSPSPSVHPKVTLCG